MLEVDRVRQLGIETPEKSVRWLRDEGNETADHDLESRDCVNGVWVDILIEVKATPGWDFRIPMSRQQLACARDTGDRYRLYRVVDVTSASPQVYLFENPYTLWQQGKAQIEPRDTYVILPNPLKGMDATSTPPQS